MGLAESCKFKRIPFPKGEQEKWKCIAVLYLLLHNHYTTSSIATQCYRENKNCGKEIDKIDGGGLMSGE